MTSTTIAFEFHYFEQGFRTLSVPQPRPTFLPEASRVGLGSNEVELGSDDCAIEASFFRTNEHYVAWLGSYRRAPDKTHGDRGNYAGLGIWIVDALPIQVSVFLNLLTKLSEQVALLGGKPDGANIQILEAALASKKADGATTEIAKIPDQIRKRLYSNQPNNTSEYCSLPSNNEKLIDVVSADLLRRMISTADGEKTNRFLYFQTSKSKVKLGTNRIRSLTESGITAAHEEAVDCLLKQLSNDISEHNNLREQMRQETGTARSEIKRLTEQVEGLTSQLNGKSNLEASFTKLRSSVTEFKAELDSVNGKGQDGPLTKMAVSDRKYDEILKLLKTISSNLNGKGLSPISDLGRKPEIDDIRRRKDAWNAPLSLWEKALITGITAFVVFLVAYFFLKYKCLAIAASF